MLILGLMEQINLAHGSLFALGAYFAYAIATPWLPLPPDILQTWADVPLGVALRGRARAVRRSWLRRSGWCSSG